MTAFLSRWNTDATVRDNVAIVAGCALLAGCYGFGWLSVAGVV